MSKTLFWQMLPYLLPIFSYVVGISRNKLRVPEQISRLLANRQVIDIVLQGIKSAEEISGKTDDEKREYVRSWAKSELYKLLGEWLPDSTVNFVIEHVIVKGKEK